MPSSFEQAARAVNNTAAIVHKFFMTSGFKVAVKIGC